LRSRQTFLAGLPLARNPDGRITLEPLWTHGAYPIRQSVTGLVMPAPTLVNLTVTQAWRSVQRS